MSSLPANHWIPIMEESLQKGDYCIIVKQEGEIIGSSVFGIINEKEKYANWLVFYMLPKYIGHGLGHSFYQIIETEMKRSSCRSCILEVLSTNERAIRFYNSHRFMKAGTFTVEENGMILSCNKMVKKIL